MNDPSSRYAFGASVTRPVCPTLQVDHLSVEIPTRRGTLVAVDDVSFRIDQREILGMVGESGAGKSLTGAAIIGLLEPPGRIAAGEVLLDGERIGRLSEEDMCRIRGRRIGTVFQDPATSLNPLYTIGRQLVETICTHLDVPAAEGRRRAIRWLQEVGISPAEQRFAHFPHQLSGGLRQRAVIALALCTGPRLVIADEPTTALDVSVQAQIIGLLKRLCREQDTSILLITHDLGILAEAADHVAVMYAGRLVEVGPFREVIARPHHPYTIGLIGSIPGIGRPASRLAQIDGTMPRPGELPTGCAFHPRCPRVFDRCRLARPDLVVTGSRSVACWLDVPEATGRTEDTP